MKALLEERTKERRKEDCATPTKEIKARRASQHNTRRSSDGTPFEIRAHPPTPLRSGPKQPASGGASQQGTIDDKRGGRSKKGAMA